MAEDIQSNRIICVGGLDNNRNHLDLSTNKPGAAIRLLNYEPGLAGGYRKINGYTPLVEGEVGGADAQGKILGLMFFDNSVTGETEIYAARRDVSSPNNYNIYLYDSTWVEVTTGLTLLYTNGTETVDKIRWDQGSDTNVNYLVFADGVNNATIFDGTTWATIDSADGGNDMANAGGDQAINAPTVVSFFENRFWLGYDLVNGEFSVLSYSAPNEPFDWTTAGGGGQIPTGMPIQNMKPFRENLYVFGLNGIKRVFFDAGSTAFLLKDVTQNIGLMNRDVVFEVGGSLIFLGQDGFRPIAGTDKIDDVQLETISKTIHNTVRARLVDNANTNMNAVVVRGKTQFRVFFGTDVKEPSASKGILGGLRTPDQQTGWEYSELLGFRASVAASTYIAGEEYVLHGDYDGIVYRQELGGDLDGEAMLTAYSTPFLDFGDTETRKTGRAMKVFMEGEEDVSVSVSVAYDWGSTDVTNPSAYILDIVTGVPIYDSIDYEYDDPGTVYGGNSTPYNNQNFEGSFFSSSFTFSTNGTELPHSIHAVVVEYSVEGKR